MPRRDALALLGAIAAAACAPAPPSEAHGPGAGADGGLRLAPLVDLVPAAGIAWLIEIHPRALLADPGFAAAVAIVAPEEAFVTFALRHGGVDPRRADEVVAASDRAGWIGLARAAVDPAAIESAFAARAAEVEGRAVEQEVTRFWGTLGSGEREQVAVFDRRAVAIERGRFGLLRAAEYFARGKLRRSLPALRAEPLVGAAARTQGACLRAFAPGPFEDAWAGGLGGVLGASTAAATALRPGAPRGTSRAAAELRLVLMGAWGADGPAAARRLDDAFRFLTRDPLGRLAGLDRPIDGPKTSHDAEAVQLEVTLDPLELAKGLRAATAASVSEIMAL